MSAITKPEQRWLREGARDDAEYAEFLTRRAAGEPVHRILGWREFWGMKFFLSPETLEPRPDSETVIEVLKKTFQPKNVSSQRSEATGGIQSHHPQEQYLNSNTAFAATSDWIPPRGPTALGWDDTLRVLDLGTGTGCLLLAALKEFPNATGIGIDASGGAITTAQKNAAENNLQDRATFQHLDWNDTAQLKSLGTFDIILCNPPYIASGEIPNLQTEVRHHDPMRALDGGADGLAPYRVIAPQLKNLLTPTGIAIFEIGYDQAATVRGIMTAQNLTTSPPHKDLGGNDRVIVVRQA